MYLGSHRGDYMRSRRGDPGLFGAIGGLIGKVAGVASRVLPFPGNLITGGASAALTRQQRMSQARSMMPGMSGQVSRFQETGYRGSVSMGSGATVECPKGYRANKSGYFLKGGQYVAPGTKCVKYRYRNVANGRALRRAIGRTAGFDKLVKRNRKALRALAKI